MPVDIKVPAVGESITEGVLTRWLKKEGETVISGDPIFELETEKATTEVPAPSAGALHILVPEGKTIAIGTVVGRLDESAAASAAKAPPPDKKEQKTPAPASLPSAERILSPAARRLAEESNVPVDQLPGTGREGRVTKEDVVNFLEKNKAPVPPAPAPAKKAEARPEPAPPPKPPAEPGKETRQPMSPIRHRIAERLVASQKTAATLTTFNEADLTAVMDLRDKYKDRFKEKHGVNLGFMSFFVKGCVEALRAFPVVNARIDGTDIVHPNACHIGVAVSTEKGLMVPVIRDADRLSFAGIEKRIAELAQRARDGKITVPDLQGGTFTITNGGIFGSMLSTPILNPPQSAILGMHAIQKRPVAVNDQVVIRPMMYLALSYDHRLIDGREAVQFLVRIKECVENPERLLLEV